MIIPDKLKLNKFRLVSIPTNAEYVQRFGLQSQKSNYTGDSSAPMPERKLDSLDRVGRADARALEFENMPELTPEPTPESTPEPTPEPANN